MSYPFSDRRLISPFDEHLSTTHVAAAAAAGVFTAWAFMTTCSSVPNIDKTTLC
jgi:hypothetical protein